MKKANKIFLLAGFISFLMLFSFNKFMNKVSYKCLIQMKDYKGEGAYVIISLLNPDGSYNETLYVQGEDDEWYFDIKAWWKFYGKQRKDIDAITGETIAGGMRATCVLNIDADKMNKGYKIRFETAVEDQPYYKDDIEILFEKDFTSSKLKGKGFIEYARMISIN